MNEVEALRDLVSMMLLSITTYEEDGNPVYHDFEYEEEGDGWNEPRSESYSCVCEEWGFDWIQTDPQCSDRPDLVDMALAWRNHVRFIRKYYLGGMPYRYCCRYSNGEIDRDELIKLLSEWDYPPMDTTDGYDTILVHPVGSFADVGDAHMDGLIDDEIYDAVLNNICD